MRCQASRGTREGDDRWITVVAIQRNNFTLSPFLVETSTKNVAKIEGVYSSSGRCYGAAQRQSSPCLPTLLLVPPLLPDSSHPSLPLSLRLVQSRPAHPTRACNPLRASYKWTSTPSIPNILILVCAQRPSYNMKLIVSTQKSPPTSKGVRVVFAFGLRRVAPATKDLRRVHAMCALVLQ